MLGAYRYTIATATSAREDSRPAQQLDDRERLALRARAASASSWVSIAPPTIVTNEPMTPIAASSVRPTAIA